MLDSVGEETFNSQEVYHDATSSSYITQWKTTNGNQAKPRTSLDSGWISGREMVRLRSVLCAVNPAEMAGRISIGWVSGDTQKQVSVSDLNWKRLGQFTASKVQLLCRATGLLVSPQRYLSIVGASNPNN